MATHHAEPGEIVDLDRWTDDLSEPHSKAILKTAALELARLVVGAGERMHPHRPCRVDGAVVIHCLEGAITLGIGEGTERTLSAGQLVCLDGGTEHAIGGVTDAVVLLTIVFPQRMG